MSEWKRHWMETCWFSMDTKEVAQSATLLETQLAQYPEPVMMFIIHKYICIIKDRVMMSHDDIRLCDFCIKAF